MGVFFALVILAGTPTDWDVARATVHEMLEDMEGMGGIKSVILYDARYSSNDAGYLLRTELTDVLKEKGIEVYLSAPLGEEPEIEVRYLINELRVVHKRSYRKLLLGPRMIERWVQADVEITVLNDNQVVSQKHLAAESKSVFPEKELDMVRSPLTEEYYTSSSAGSLWEPLVVTALVGALIYIFYAPKD